MKKLKLLTVLLLFASLEIAGAQPPTDQEQSVIFPLGIKKYSFEIAPEVSHIKYEEPDVMEEEGTMFGIGFAYTYRHWAPDSLSMAQDQQVEPAGGPMFRAQFRFSAGEVDYDGALQDGTPLQINDIDDRMVELRALIGSDLLTASSLNTLYLGFAYRWLNDDSSFHPSGYERESNYLYIPLGFETMTPVGQGWTIGGTAEFDAFLWGRQESDLRAFGYGKIENDQNQGYGWRASLKFQKTNFSIEPFIRYWNIEESDMVDGWVEPDNESTEYGIRFVWRF